MTAAKTIEEITADLERAADAVFNAEFLIVAAGPIFDEGLRSPFDSDYCDPQLISKPNKFMGFWGEFFNSYSDRNPHEGFQIISRWRDRLFSADDIRKKQKKKEEESEYDKLVRCMVYTGNISNLFQKAGLPNDEVYEALGNITTWQCSRVPVCSGRTFQADRAFRFVIDEATREAMPVKYVSDRRDAKQLERLEAVDSDEEELQSMQGMSKHPFEVKLSREERQRRQQRRLEQPQVLRHFIGAQIGDKRWPDLFSGFMQTQSAAPSAPFTFPGTEPDPNGLRRTRESEPSPADVPVEAPARCSHMLEHANALLRRCYDGRMGSFYGVDPEKWLKDREQFYQSSMKIFVSEHGTTSSKRARYVTYNVSVAIQSAKGPPIVSEALLSKLFAVYPKNAPPVPVTDSSNAVIGSIAPDQAATVELMQTVHDGWSQGKKGLFYFSNITHRQTMQEPVHSKLIDVLHIPFPVDGNGKPTVELQDEALVSVMCETIIQPEAMPADTDKALRAALHDKNGNPCSYGSNVWQLIGKFKKLPFTESEFKGKEALEYILVGREHHALKIGVSKQATGKVCYMQLQSPCDDMAPQTVPSHTKLKAVPVDPAPQAAATRKEDHRPPAPTPNHLMCVGCHDVARPYVLMARPGCKDDGFCQSQLAARTKVFKAWEKLMMDAIKADSNKSLVILEVGCDKRMDPARGYSEKTFKVMKQSRCTFIRLSSQDLETKAKGGEAEAANYIVAQISPQQGLSIMDRAISERLRKLR
jgi:hypothetical protein